MSEQRRFTLEEANAALPDLVSTLEAMRKARAVMIDRAEVVKRGVAGNGGGEDVGEYQDAVELLKRETERLSSEGIILRDIESGLVDFPSEREGQPMFLCWQLGEPEVAFWHPVDTGFAGRRPL